MKIDSKDIKRQYKSMLNEFCHLATSDHIKDVIDFKSLSPSEFEINGYPWNEYYSKHNDESIEFVRIDNYENNLEYIYFFYEDGIVSSILFDVVSDDGEDTILDGITIADIK